LEWRHPPRAGETRLTAGESQRNRALYAIPRAVDLCTVVIGDGCNRFPVDLHGAIGDAWFLSLRRGTRSLAQVLEARRALVAAMPAEAAAEVYALGPSHRAEPRAIDPSEPRSAGGIPVPTGALGWWEIVIGGVALELGEHVVLHGRELASRAIPPRACRLHHVHRDLVTRVERAGGSVPIVGR
jgi:hypothetical protein